MILKLLSGEAVFGLRGLWIYNGFGKDGRGNPAEVE